jgi:hypothetical protein
MKNNALLHLFAALVALMITFQALAQGTTEFTFQGELQDDGAPAEGLYDFQFLVYDQSDGGDPYPVTQNRNGVAVSAGIFTVQLDFGVDSFSPGGSRWLSIGVKRSGEVSYSTLSPRQRIGAAPYAISSLDAQSLGGTGASEYVLSTDPRMTDARTPLPGSNDYIRNGTTTQSPSNFNISGTGVAEVLDAQSHLAIRGRPIVYWSDLSPLGTLLIGQDAGLNISNGSNVLYLGTMAGMWNENGMGNTFLGSVSGQYSKGSDNVFVGEWSGHWSESSENVYVGKQSGSGLILGGVSGGKNTALGFQAGISLFTGEQNVFLGWKAGTIDLEYLVGSGNTVIGSNATVAADANYATVIGADAVSMGSNTIVLGRASGSDTVKVPGNVVVSGSVEATGAGSFFNTLGTYKIEGSTVISVAGNTNLMVGKSAGFNLVDGEFSVYVGGAAGSNNQSGTDNTFLGALTGRDSTGSGNTFIGRVAGIDNQGDDNTFVGRRSGFGVLSEDSSGSRNTALGKDAGNKIHTGEQNVFIGWNATSLSDQNVVGSNNTIIGADARVAANANFATALGAGSTVSTSNTIALGRSNGSDHVLAPGGLTLGSTVTQYSDDLNINDPNGNASIYLSGDNQTKGINIAVDSTTGGDATLFFSQYDGAVFQDRLVINSGGRVEVRTLGVSGAIALCRNASNEVASCSSSIRYKTAVRDFSGGIDLLTKLRPVFFEWIDSGMPDVGLVAEEVAEVEPLLATYSAEGEVEGVKYDRIGVLLVNVIREQQAQIEAQDESIRGLREELSNLRMLVCASRQGDPSCSP